MYEGVVSGKTDPKNFIDFERKSGVQEPNDQIVFQLFFYSSLVHLLLRAALIVLREDCYHRGFSQALRRDPRKCMEPQEVLRDLK